MTIHFIFFCTVLLSSCTFFCSCSLKKKILETQQNNSSTLYVSHRLPASSLIVLCHCLKFPFKKIEIYCCGAALRLFRSYSGVSFSFHKFVLEVQSRLYSLYSPCRF